jgi:hypothetical protein
MEGIGRKKRLPVVRYDLSITTFNLLSKLQIYILLPYLRQRND